MIKTKQVGNKKQLMPEGFLLCKENNEFFWEEESTGKTGWHNWNKWWVRKDAIFFKKNGYSYSGDQPSYWDKYELFLKKLHNKLKERLVGECKMCGLCCRENWRFNYIIDVGNETIRPKYRTNRPKDYVECEAFDAKLNKCKNHNNKIPICKYWPILESDLGQIDCPGFKLKDE